MCIFRRSLTGSRRSETELALEREVEDLRTRTAQMEKTMRWVPIIRITCIEGVFPTFGLGFDNSIRELKREVHNVGGFAQHRGEKL